MARPETVKLHIEYGRLISSMIALCPIIPKSCTCWQLSLVDYLLSYTIPSRSTALMMAAAAQNTNNTTIRSEGKLVHLEQLMTHLPYPVASQAARDAYEALYDAQNEVACLMLGNMSPELQRTLENYKAYDMIQELKNYEDGQSVSSYLLKMKSYLDTLERLGYAMPKELGVSLILNSLNKDYDQFIQNYNMHSMGKTLVELHAMLKLHEKGIPKKAKTPTVLAIRKGKIQKDKKKPRGAKGKAKGKNKLAYAPKTKIPPPPKRDNPAKASICHHYKEVGHWRRNCCGTHICNTSQELRGSRKLKHGALSMYMGNRMRAAVEAVRSFELILSSGLIIVLDNCHFAPTVTRGVVLISHLVKNGYIHTFTNYGISVSKYNVSYFNAIPRDGIYEIDMHNLYPNVSSNYNVSNKRAKHRLDSYYLWHCRLGHINKKRMDMLQQNVRVPIHRSVRIPQLPDRYGYYADVEEYELGDLDEPPNYKAALVDPEYDKWLEAMNIEMQSMKDNQVCSYGSKRLYPNLRSRLWGNLLFCCRLRAIRILLSIAAFYDYEIWQMDVKTAFLNGHLSEDVYMAQPKGFVDIKHPNKVCKLERSIYRLKQASRSWNKRFDEEIKKICFTQNPDEPCVYLKASRSNVAFLVLYVDDILLMGNNVTMLKEVKSWLCKCFSMKDLGEAAYILGIKIISDRSKRLISLSQSAYLEKILKKFRMENSKKGYTLMMEKPDYRKSQGAKTPTETAVKSILKYLRNTKDMFFVYGAKPEDELKVSCSADAKAEYIVAAEASMEAVWMRKFIDGLGGVMPLNKRPMEMLCDNEPALAIASDPGILKGARHFQRKYHYIREVIKEGEIVLKKVHTDDNVADPFTKPMPFNKHFEHAMAIGIVPASSLM
ncbi:retrotransposon protein, putative, ty1-copia subclass [Tanacetum coccineum]